MMLDGAIAAALGAVAVALFAHSADSHMIMSFPVPYNLNTLPFVEVNPLDGWIYQYPCQGLFDVENRTVVEAGGAPTLVQFMGGSQHGGGSCQFSISYDDPISAGGWNTSAKFKTIYTIIGGCPVSSPENLEVVSVDQLGRADSIHCGNDTGNNCIREFLIPFPGFLKNGNATFSWTWHNKMGDREIYQTCAPVTITGGTGDQGKMNALPDIFLGNLPAAQSVPGYTPCKLANNQVVNYPNPGKYGRVLESPTDPNVMPNSYCSQVPAASVLPSFVEDARTVLGGVLTSGTSATATTTVAEPETQTKSATESLFATIPTDSTGTHKNSMFIGPNTFGIPIPPSRHHTPTPAAFTQAAESEYGPPQSTEKAKNSTTVYHHTVIVTETATSFVTVFAHTVTVSAHNVTDSGDDCPQVTEAITTTTHPETTTLTPPTSSTSVLTALTSSTIVLTTSSSTTEAPYGPSTSTTTSSSTSTALTPYEGETAATPGTTTTSGTGTSLSLTTVPTTTTISDTITVSVTGTDYATELLTAATAELGSQTGDLPTSMSVLTTLTIPPKPVDSAAIDPTWIQACYTTIGTVVSSIENCFH